MTEFRMPSLGADMEAGTLVSWKVKSGDRVKRGDIVAEVETEKSDIDVEIFTSGVIHELLVQPGRKVPVGTPLATIVEDGEAQPAVRQRVSPLARKVASELGVDVAAIRGSGAGGAVTSADVERAAAAKPAAAPEPVAAGEPVAQFEPGMRHAIAAAMARSNREIPHYYLETQIDMHRALSWLRVENTRRPVKDRLLPAVLLIRSVALALRDTPELNGWWRDKGLEIRKDVNIGFAISVRTGGLLTPAILNAGQKNLTELMVALSDLIVRTRAGKLRSSEVSEGSITITNLGDVGVETVFGVIYPPQVALVGFGRIHDRPWAVNGLLGIRPVLTATLAGDHRATDGRRGAQFLEAVDRCLQNPEQL
jgi:pyruvate dehydrogenase E2 component (dihydrolipoamide acetyltransferase)